MHWLTLRICEQFRQARPLNGQEFQGWVDYPLLYMFRNRWRVGLEQITEPFNSNQIGKIGVTAAGLAMLVEVLGELGWIQLRQTYGEQGAADRIDRGQWRRV